MSVGNIITVDPRTDPRWRSLATSSRGSLFTSPLWISAVANTYGFTPEARVAVNDLDQPIGGLAWVRITDMRGDRLCSLPFCDRADPFVSDEPLWDALVAGTLTPDTRFSLRCLHATVPQTDARLDRVGAAAWHATRLEQPVEALYRRLAGRTQRNIALAERKGVRVETSGDLSAVRRFHRLHVVLRKRKYRMLAPPVSFFERIWHEFSADDAVVTALAYHGGEVIAGAMFLVWNGVLYYKFGASLPEYLALRPNHGVWWAGLRWGAERGLCLLDWGLSDLDQPGLVAFKRQWATDEQRIVTLRSRSEPSPIQVEAGQMLNEITRLLTDEAVPDRITAEAGALLYRYFC